MASAALASNLTFSKVPAQPVYFGGPHVDLNGDGREDLVTWNTNGGFDVILSTGDGKYAAPVPYSLPGGADAQQLILAGDFNGDGKADLLLSGEQDHALHLFLNNGFGRFSQKAVFANWPVDSYTAVVGDFNRDGRMDVAFIPPPGTSVTVWFGNGKSGFTVGPTSRLAIPAGTGCDNILATGDFDGDGLADLICQELENPDFPVLYGDGAGRFVTGPAVHSSSDFSGFNLADVDGDGKTDVLVDQYNPYLKSVSIRYGSATRKWTRTATIPTLDDYLSGSAADVNGDGINDLVVGEIVAPGLPNPGFRTGVFLRNSNGTYQKEQIIAIGDGSVEFTGVIRANRDSKPDLLLNGFVLLNTTVGNFPPCAAPNAFEGINVCSPAAGATVTSPVSFKVGAAGQVPMRDLEVWVDGKKLALQLDGFSHYTFLNRSLSFSAGTHAVAIFAAGWDQSLQKKTFTLKVK